MSSQFRKEIRRLIDQMHKKKYKMQLEKGQYGIENLNSKEEFTCISPEVQIFIQHMFDEWHKKLARKRPRIVTRQMKKQVQNIPGGLKHHQFLWICRCITRWHRRNAGKCYAMSGWSSGEAGDDTSEDDDSAQNVNKKSHRFERRNKICLNEQNFSGSEATDCLEEVSSANHNDLRILASYSHS